MKKIFGILIGVFLCLSIAGTANALQMITNGDFETGGLKGWNEDGDVEVRDANANTVPDFVANYSGMDDYYAALGFDTSDQVNSLSQEFTVSGASSITVSFDYAFGAVDWDVCNDDTFVSIYSSSGDWTQSITLKDLESNLTTAKAGYVEKTFDLDPSWTTNSEMSFTLTEAGGGWCDGTFSAAALDNVSANVDPVPEPATMLLLGTGLLGMAGFFRRKFISKN